jgi:hypothetical protein
MGLPASVALVLQGIILFLVLGGEILTQYRLRIDRPVRAPAAAQPSSTEGARS